MIVCPVCGKAGAACGDTPLAFPPLDLTKELAVAVTKDDPIRLPKQSDGSGRHGVSGYRGNVETYDPKTDSPYPDRTGSVVSLSAEGDTAETTATGDLPDGWRSLNKPELVALAESRDVDSSGTKDEIIARLEA
jgi:hypothetical protein